MTFNMIKKFQIAIRQGGFSQAIRMSLDYLQFKRAINARRQQLAIKIAGLYRWKIAYGPFVGMQISQSSWWGKTDLASKILGFYEAEVLAVLSGVDKTQYRHFVDLGAADGYYAIGAIYADLFEDAYAFEMSDQGQEVIRANAKLNGVSKRVHVYGVADENFDQQIPDVSLAQTVMLIDIEGGEFDLLDALLLQKLKRSLLVIELHEFMVDNGSAKLAALIKRLEPLYKLTWLKTGARDLSNFDALESFNDTDRWLLCSEGRMRLQKWVICEPLPV